MKKLFSTFILCSILISSISNNYIFGNDEEKGIALITIGNEDKGDDNSKDIQLRASNKKPWRSLFTRKNACRLFVALLVTAGIGIIGVEIIGSGSSTPLPATLSPASVKCQKYPSPLMNIYPPNSNVTCPVILPLNGGEESGCHYGPYEFWLAWLTTRAAEAAYSQQPLPYCKNNQSEWSSFKIPKDFMCDADSPHLDPLLKQMIKNGIPYYYSTTVFFNVKGVDVYTYDAEHFEVPNIHFTVKEIEDSCETMEMIRNGIILNPCKVFKLVEESSPNASSPNKKQKQQKAKKLKYKSRRRK